MQETLIDQGINLMLFGMGTVFIFLTILVFATTLMSTVVNRLVPVEETVAEQPQTNNPKTVPQTISPNIVSAIQKAIAEHRKQ